MYVAFLLWTPVKVKIVSSFKAGFLAFTIVSQEKIIWENAG